VNLVAVWSGVRAFVEQAPGIEFGQPVQGERLSSAVGQQQLAPVLEELRRSGELAADSSASDHAWLHHTLDSPFIDPLRRITLGLRSVRNPADIIVSLAPGYHFGDARADLLVGVTGTHGSLRSTSSLAFAMRTGSALWHSHHRQFVAMNSRRHHARGRWIDGGGVQLAQELSCFVQGAQGIVATHDVLRHQ